MNAPARPQRGGFYTLPPDRPLTLTVPKGYVVKVTRADQTEEALTEGQTTTVRRGDRLGVIQSA